MTGIFDPGIFDPAIFDTEEAEGSPLRVKLRPRLEIWSNLECAGGVRLHFVKDAANLVGTFAVADQESLTFTLPLLSRARAFVREGRVARVWRTDTDFDEWPIGPVVTRRDLGGRTQVTCYPVLYRLGTGSPVPSPDNTQRIPALDVGVIGLSAEEIIQAFLIDNPIVAAETPWLTIGTIEPTVLIDAEWSSANKLKVLRAICEAIEGTGEPAELQLRRDGTTSYAIDILHEIGSDAPRPHIRFARNFQFLEVTVDPTDRATRIEALLAPMAGESTYLGGARWLVTDVDDTDPEAVIVTLADPAGGKGPVGFDDQLVGWFALLEKTGGTYEVLESDATAQTITLPRRGALAVGAYVQFRTTEPLTGTRAVGPSLPTLNSIGTAILPLQISAIAGSVFTADPLSTSPAIRADGQYVDAYATFAQFVAAPIITGSNNEVHAVHTIPLASVTDIAVDDLCYEASFDGTAYYYDAGQPLRVVSVDGGGPSVDVELYNSPGVEFTRLMTAGVLLVVRPQPGSAVVTDADEGDSTLTLDLDEDAEDWNVDDGPGLLFLTIATGQGEEPYYLEHPVYAASPSEDGDGIGVKFGTIDRGDLVGVANLLPNPVMREWSDLDEPPDGWSTREQGVDGVTIAKETDPLYTRYGGASLYFKLSTGGFPDQFHGTNAIVSPVIPWTAVRVGERFSVRVSLLLINWFGDIALEAKLGVKLPDGTVKTWEWPDATAMLVPADADATLLPPSTSITVTPGDTWVDAVINGHDITSGGLSDRVTEGDIAQALGYVVVIAQAKGRVEGYLDAITVTPSMEALPEIAEFGDANRSWQTTNFALEHLAPPQVGLTTQIVDLKRMDPTLTEKRFVKGGTAYVSDVGLGLRAVTQRVAKVIYNYLKPSDTRIELANQARRLTNLLLKSRRRAEQNLKKRIDVVEKGRGGGGGGGGGGGSTGFSWDDWYEFFHRWDFESGLNTIGATRVSVNNDTFQNWTIDGAATITDDYTTVNGRNFQRIDSIGTSAVYQYVGSHQDFPSTPSLEFGNQIRVSIPIKAVAGVDGYFWTRCFATDEDGVHPARWLWQVKVTITAGVVTATAVTGSVLAVENRGNGEYRLVILATEGNNYAQNDEQEIILIDGPEYNGYGTGFYDSFALDPARQVSAIDSVMFGPVEVFSYIPGVANLAEAALDPNDVGPFANVGDEHDSVVDWFDRDYWFNTAPELRRNSPLGAWTSDNTGAVTVDSVTGHLVAVGTGTAHISWSVTTGAGTVTSNTLTFTIT